MNFQDSLMLARVILETTDCSPAEAVGNPAIPKEYRAEIEERLNDEQTTELIPVKVIADQDVDPEWLDEKDRGTWYYWRKLRYYWLQNKKWTTNRINSLDDSSDKVLRHMSPPDKENFDVRGLVLGYVQSGKTANYTALIAKAADVGYRLFIVLSGMDNGLRRQTQIRLEQELVGISEIPGNAVPLPERGKQWHTFTTRDIDGDFQQGNVNTAALQGTQPVLLVIKKNGAVLRRVIKWLSEADSNTIAQIPALIIDDEADQASIDTKGDRMTEGDEQTEDSEDPSTINRLIRNLLNKFTRRSFTAYTATPFANILIPFDQYTPNVKNDLYPKNFIIDLPKPKFYVGAEELFGETGLTGEESEGGGDGINVLRSIPTDEEAQWGSGQDAPASLRSAMIDFVLAGAAKTQRGGCEDPPEKSPSTMLIHTSHLTEEHGTVREIVQSAMKDLRDEWRYGRDESRHDKSSEIEKEMMTRWNEDFCLTTDDYDSSKILVFDELRNHIGQFLESVQVKAINSTTDEILDYEKEPHANTIAIGGNKLSRGLTLEGLLVSYFTRESNTPMYDTVMQMARWFGFRQDYVDLIRLYMTDSLADKFAHLSVVEKGLRDDIAIYATKGITPKECGLRILRHPSMRVTSQSKSRFARNFITVYSGMLFQTFRFPMSEPEVLAESAESNLISTVDFLSALGPFQRDKNKFIWRDVAADAVVTYLGEIENTEHHIDLMDIKKYIDGRVGDEELTNWTIVIHQLQNKKTHLKSVDWGIGEEIWQISRTRLVKKTNSLGAILEPKNLEIGLSQEQLSQARQQFSAEQCDDSLPKPNFSRIIRSMIPAENGLLILYPISKFHDVSVHLRGNRAHLYENPDDECSKNLIGVAISFPESKKVDFTSYTHGTPGWNPQQ